MQMFVREAQGPGVVGFKQSPYPLSWELSFFGCLCLCLGTLPQVTGCGDREVADPKPPA